MIRLSRLHIEEDKMTYTREDNGQDYVVPRDTKLDNFRVHRKNIVIEPSVLSNIMDGVERSGGMMV